jgi:hypothetical protein
MAASLTPFSAKDCFSGRMREVFPCKNYKLHGSEENDEERTNLVTSGQGMTLLRVRPVPNRIGLPA